MKTLLIVSIIASLIYSSLGDDDGLRYLNITSVDIQVVNPDFMQNVDEITITEQYPQNSVTVNCLTLKNMLDTDSKIKAGYVIEMDGKPASSGGDEICGLIDKNPFFKDMYNSGNFPDGGCPLDSDTEYCVTDFIPDNSNIENMNPVDEVKVDVSIMDSNNNDEILATITILGTIIKPDE